MRKADFNKKYGGRGGVKKLREMMSDRQLCTLTEIAIHFKVSRERVRQWSQELFWKRYDPRYKRRKRKQKTNG